jgi:ABC-type multidrug transport system ATPase subunit
MTPHPAVSCSAITKRYGPVVALDAVDAVLARGRITGLIGRNGAGKTTLMRAIAGMIALDGGDLRVGAHAAGSDPARRAVSFLPETPALYVSLTVWEHIRFMGLAFGVDDWTRRGGDLLRAFDLEAHRERLPAELSLGMRRKLSIAMAMLRGSEVLLLDEPFNGLDPQAARELRTRVVDVADRGAAVLVSMHGLRELEAMAHDYIVLDRGRVAAAGTALDLKQRAAVGQGSTLEDAFVELSADA